MKKYRSVFYISSVSSRDQLPDPPPADALASGALIVSFYDRPDKSIFEHNRLWTYRDGKWGDIPEDILTLKLDAPFPFSDHLMHMYMRMAKTVASESYCTRAKIGCVIVTPSGLISVGYNGTPSKEPNVCEDENNITLPTVVHAEANAIAKFAVSHESSKNGVLFVTQSPCELCAHKIVAAGITHVFYDQPYRNTKGIDILNSKGVFVEHLECSDIFNK